MDDDDILILENLARMGQDKHMAMRLSANYDDKPPNNKDPCVVMESKQLSIQVGAYNLHFGKYSNRHKKKVTQLVLGVVWKKVYAINIHEFPKIACKMTL